MKTVARLSAFYLVYYLQVMLIRWLTPQLLMGSYQAEVKEQGKSASKFSGTQLAAALHVDPFLLFLLGLVLA